MCPFYTIVQMCNFDTDIGTEELAHLEMVATIVHQLTKNLSMEQIEESGFRNYYVDHTVGIWPQAAGGIPFNACEFQSKGDIITCTNRSSSCGRGRLCTSRGSVKQTGKIAVNRNTHNIITKTHTHTPLKAVDFSFRPKRKDKLGFSLSHEGNGKEKRLIQHRYAIITLYQWQTAKSRIYRFSGVYVLDLAVWR